MTRKQLLPGILALLVVLAEPVLAHTATTSNGMKIEIFLITIGVISLGVAAAIYLLRRFESYPGSLPMKKIGIIAGITIAINAVIFGIIYL